MKSRVLVLSIALAGCLSLGGYLLTREPPQMEGNPASAVAEMSNPTAFPEVRAPTELAAHRKPSTEVVLEGVEQPEQTSEQAPVRTKAARDWVAEYNASTREGLEQELKLTDQLYTELVAAEFDRKFASGDYKVIGHGGTYPLSDWDESLINRVDMSGDPGAPIKKCTLLEADYPDLYDLKHRKEWLTKRIAELAVAESVVDSSVPR